MSVTISGNEIQLTLQDNGLRVSVVGQQGPAGPPVPAGTATRVLFSDGTAVDTDAEFTYDKTTNKLNVVGTLDVQSGGSFTTAAGLAFRYDVATAGYIQTFNTRPLFLNSLGNQVVIGSGDLGFGTTANGQRIVADGTSYFEFRNGSTAQGVHVFHGRADANNYARLSLDFTGTTARIWTNKTGTGATLDLSINSAGRIQFGTNSGGKLLLGTDGHLIPDSVTNAYDVGSPSWMFRNGYFGTSINVGVRAALNLSKGGGAGTLSLVRAADGFGWWLYPNASNTLTWGTGSGSETVVMTLTDSGLLSAASASIPTMIGQIDVRNGTNPQVVKIFNTYTDAVNNERLFVGFSLNKAYVATEKVGTGVSRVLVLGGEEVRIAGAGGGSEWWTFATGHLTANAAYNITTTGNIVAPVLTNSGNLQILGNGGNGELLFSSGVGTSIRWSTVSLTLDSNGFTFSGGAVRSSSGGIGYATGAGGTVTQLTSKSTAVTLNKVCGEITMNAAALAANTAVTFTLNNSTLGANDMLLVQHASAGTAGAYDVNATAGSGLSQITVRNMTGGSLSEAIVLRFTIIKSVNA